MSRISVCRVCLIDNLRMYNIMNTRLQEVYEKLTNISLQTEDGKPHIVCYMCYSKLKQCYMLKERSVRADRVLTQLLLSNIGLTQEAVKLVDRQTFKLTDGLCFSQPEYIMVVAAKESPTNNSLLIKEEVPVTFEGHENEENEAKDIKQTEKQSDSDIDHEDSKPSFSDSEDDLPLKDISIKKRIHRRARNVRKKRKDGFKADYAKEILLTREEQLQEMQERAKSVNYQSSPYKCDLCYKGFIEERAYKNHKERHDLRSGALECEVCRMRYRTVRQLRTHHATSHGRRYQCNKCSHTSHTANQAREHEKWHGGYTYECQLCGKILRKSTSYLTHMRKRHPTEHVCDICGDSFVGQHGLQMHRSKTHKRDRKLPEREKEAASDRFCSECNIQFLTLEAWKRHILTSIKHTLDNENRSQCRICSSRYPAGGARAHLREHERDLKLSHATRPLRPAANLACDQCGAHFRSRPQLLAHVKRIHLGVKYNKNIVCEVCGKKCTSNASLKYHQRTHTGEKPYSCTCCSKRFADNNQLRIHARTHTGERPYSCGACGKRFSQKPALNRHYRVHTGAKPYECTYCSKTFTQSNSLKLHVRTVHLKLPNNHRKNKVQNAIQETPEKGNALQTL